MCNLFKFYRFINKSCNVCNNVYKIHIKLLPLSTKICKYMHNYYFMQVNFNFHFLIIDRQCFVQTQLLSQYIKRHCLVVVNLWWATDKSQTHLPRR